MCINTRDYTVKETFSVYQHLKGYLILTVHVGIVIDWATLMKMLPKPWHYLICMYVIRSYIFRCPKKIICTWLSKVHMHNLFWCLNKFDIPTAFHLSFKRNIYSVYSCLISIIGTIFSHADCSHFHRVWCRQQ